MQQNIIIYVSGCYGTFVEWLLNYLQSNVDSLPFKESGSSHIYVGNFLYPPEEFFKYVNSPTKNQLSRCHHGLYEHANQHSVPYQGEYSSILQEDINLLKQHFDKILILTYDYDSILCLENNILDKIYYSEEEFQSFFEKYGYSNEYFKELLTKDPETRLKHILNKEIHTDNSPLTQQNLDGWGKASIYDFDTWELRELLSLYWFTRNEGQITAWQTIKTNNPDTLTVSVSDLKTDFGGNILKICDFFNITPNQDRLAELDNIHTEWRSRQTQINKDDLCQNIVNCILSNTWLDWPELSIIDQAWIQKQLRDNGVGIKCYNLNDFPSNTQDFQSLLEKL